MAQTATRHAARGGEGHGSHWLERPEAEGSVVLPCSWCSCPGSLLQLDATGSIFEYLWIYLNMLRLMSQKCETCFHAEQGAKGIFLLV